jgi:hypothetical protein
MNKENEFIYEMEHYSAIMKNEIMSFAGKWMELEIVMLREKREDSERKILCFLSYADSAPIWGWMKGEGKKGRERG